MNILFINIPTVSLDYITAADANFALTIHPPEGLLYIADSIRNKDYINNIMLADFGILDYSNKELLTDGEEAFFDKIIKKAIGELEIDVIGITLMFSSSYDFYKDLVVFLKSRFKNTVIVTGGNHATSTADYLINNNLSDFVILGEGEKTFSELLENIFLNKEIIEIEGIKSKTTIFDDKQHKKNSPFLTDLDVIDFNSYYSLIDMKKYVDNFKIFSLSKQETKIRSFPIMASRGCPGLCTFCASKSVHGRKMRWRSIENVKKQMEFLYHEYNVTSFVLMDDNLFPKKNALDLFKMISSLKIPNLEIIIQNTGVNYTDEELIDAMCMAHVDYIGFAIESGSNEIQKKIRKKCDLEKAKKLISYSKNKGMEVRAFYIIGFPYETVEQMQQTIEFAKKADTDWATINVAIPLVGSEMYEQFIDLGVIEEGPISWNYGNLRSRNFDTAEITAKEIVELAYKSSLEINFIKSSLLNTTDFSKAKKVFRNFTEVFPFHIFAWANLYKIYKLEGNKEEYEKIISTLIHLIDFNSSSKDMYEKYGGMLDEEVRLRITE